MLELNVNQKKEFIVLTAIDLINENGINNVSTKEIAKRIGISESLIFKIYPKKYDLILAVLDFFSLYDKDLYRTAMDKYEDAIEALEFYLHKFIQYYENYPAITSIYQVLNMDTGIPQINSRSEEITLNRMDNIRQLLIRAQESGKINHEIDTDIAAEILYSTMVGLCIKWRKTNYEFSLLDRVDKVLNMILEMLVR